jgi:hypothetical protein
MTLEDRAAASAAGPGEAGAGRDRLVRSIDNGRRVSEVLREIAETWPEERVTLGDLIDLFGDRGHGLLMLTLTLPNLVPIYLPGLSAVTGLPMAFVALQMALGVRHPWMPRFLRRRSVAVTDLRRIVERAEPWLRPVERVLRPRLHALTDGVAKRLIGALCVVLALLLSLPIPLTNIPLAAPVAVFSLGVAERDGVAVSIATVGSVAALAFVFTASWALLAGVLAFLGL